MQLILSFIYTVICYFVLMLISTNLIGIILEGLFHSVAKNKIILNNSRLNKTLLFTFLFALLYLLLLYYYWNLGLMISATILMICRIPDKIIEIKTGEKTTYSNMQKKPIDYFTTILMWLVIPLIWYSIYY
jgi:hypothetical protein